ncbi:MAG TPA: hypothetical protein VFK52_01830 [Nocardioidaceae bacterium]|nr:hypothetical protein [Nocardioidaceae bacterium]
MPSPFSRLAGRRPRYADVAATLALVVSLTGTSYAVATVTSADIKDGTIRSRDIGTGGIRSVDVADGTLSLADIADSAEAALQGQKGDQGEQGEQGEQGVPGADGTAKGYAFVNGSTGQLGSFGGAKNVANVNIKRVSAGLYCFSGLPFTVQNVVATMRSGSGHINVSVGDDPVNCDDFDTTWQAVVRTWATSSLQDEDFYVLFN